MKVFVSHQRADSALALWVSDHLKTSHQIDSYLDVVDPSSNDGPTLADQIRAQMGKCTQLLAVVSGDTQKSWWVPWEIGVASEKDYPLATYTHDFVELPTYLKQWPFLRNVAELDIYARASKSAQRVKVNLESLQETASTARLTSTRQFYKELRAGLNR